MRAIGLVVLFAGLALFGNRSTAPFAIPLTVVGALIFERASKLGLRDLAGELAKGFLVTLAVVGASYEVFRYFIPSLP